MLVWNQLKQIAYQTWETIYQVEFEPLKNFVIKRMEVETSNFA